MIRGSGDLSEVPNPVFLLDGNPCRFSLGRHCAAAIWIRTPYPPSTIRTADCPAEAPQNVTKPSKAVFVRLGLDRDAWDNPELIGCFESISASLRPLHTRYVQNGKHEATSAAKECNAPGLRFARLKARSFSHGVKSWSIKESRVPSGTFTSKDLSL